MDKVLIIPINHTLGGYTPFTMITALKSEISNLLTLEYFAILVLFCRILICLMSLIREYETSLVQGHG